MKIKVNQASTDIFDRYQMPALEICTEGKSHNTKIIIKNMNAIAKSLNRSQNQILKFIEYEKGVKIETKGDKNTLKGMHLVKDLQDIIYKYINIFVLCKVCDNPETVYRLTDDNKLCMECLACGEKCEIVDHKLNKTILNDIKKGGEHCDQKYDNSGNDDKINITKIINTYDVNEAYEKINDSIARNEITQNEAVLELIKNFENDNSFLLIKRLVKPSDYQFLLSNFELVLVQQHTEDQITDCVAKIIDNQIISKEDCKKYFSSKSKVLKRDDSNLLRKNLKLFLKDE